MKVYFRMNSIGGGGLFLLHKEAPSFYLLINVGWLHYLIEDLRKIGIFSIGKEIQR